MSQIKRGEQWIRPNFTYHESPANSYSHEATQSQLLESIRNCLEQIRDSQMLKCDVAHAIKTMRRDIAGLRRDLKRKKRRKPGFGQ